MTTNGDRIRILLVRIALQAEDPVRALIQSAQDMEYLTTAQGMDAGLALLSSLAPEIVLVECGPDLIEFTTQARKISATLGIILLSAGKDSTGAQYVVDALAAGAFDVVPALESSATMSNLLFSKIRCCSIKQYSRMARIGKTAQNLPAQAFVAEHVHIPSTFSPSLCRKYDAVLIGVSTGGPEALMALLPSIPAAFPVPIVIVLHMPKEFTGAMAESLNRKCKLQVTEVQEGDVLEAGHAYLAQGGRHCLLERGPEHQLRLRLGDGFPENGCKPSVDVLFRSGVETLGAKAIAVVLTGMGSDGAEGVRALKPNGVPVIVQDEASCVVWGMPGSVVRAGLADEILPLTSIAANLCERVGCP